VSAVTNGFSSRNTAAALAVLLGIGSPAVADTPMTGKVILEQMPRNEFVVFVTGIVEGMAYARFRKDTLASGSKVEDGMTCIRDWFHGDAQVILKIEDAFRQYDQYAPWVVLGAMIKKKCGE